MTIIKQEHEVWPLYWIDGASVNKYQKLITCTDDDTFHIGQCYENVAAKTIQCVGCDGKEFNVGEGKYFTAIRCVKCKWEMGG